MQWVVKLTLRNSTLVKVIRQDCAIDATSQAEEEVASLLAKWEEKIIDSCTLSYTYIGRLACRCDERVVYYGNKYFYEGVCVSNDIDFNLEFAAEYERIAKATALDEQLEEHY